MLFSLHLNALVSFELPDWKLHQAFQDKFINLIKSNASRFETDLVTYIFCIIFSRKHKKLIDYELWHNLFSLTELWTQPHILHLYDQNLQLLKICQFSICTSTLLLWTLLLEQARKLQATLEGRQPKLWLTHWLTHSLTGVRCRATSVA